MKKLSVVIASAFVLVGCVAVEPTSVSYPAQTEENVQNTEQSEQDFQESETNSEIVESVQEDVQLSESETSSSVIESTPVPERTESGTVSPEPVEQEDSRERAENDENVIVDAPNVEESARTREIVNDEICKLREVSGYRGLAASFPSLTYEIPHTGRVDVALVFLEWGDLRGTEADYEYYLEQTSMFEDFYYMVSEGKLNIEIHHEKQWFEVGPTYKDYMMSQAQDGGDWRSKDIMQRNGDAFVAASDSVVDFTGIDAVIFAVPRAEEVFETGPHAFGHNKQNGLYTNEGTIWDWMSAGTWFIENPGQPSWVFYAHEFGHSLGLVDFRDSQQSGQIIGEKYAVNPMGGYEIMDNQGGPTRTMTAWVRWLQGWLNDDQVLCIDANDINDELYVVNQLNKLSGETEALVIKTSPTTAIVIESRRWDAKFDVPVVNSKDGIIVYTVDATKGHSQGPLRLVSPRDITRYLSEPNTYPDWRTLDAVFYKGNSATVNGITITVESLSDTGDTVRISK